MIFTVEVLYRNKIVTFTYSLIWHDIPRNLPKISNSMANKMFECSDIISKDDVKKCYLEFIDTSWTSKFCENLRR